MSHFRKRAPKDTVDGDTISRRIVAENHRLDRELDSLLASEGVNRENLSAMAELGDALPRETKKRFEKLLEAELEALPDTPRLSIECLSRTTHGNLAASGLTLLRA